MAKAICSLTFLTLVSGNDFLGAQHHPSEGRVLKEEVESTFLEELNSMNPVTAQAWEQEMRPLFNTMDKNEHGNLEPSAVRYVLHRYFAYKHGWRIVGLDKAEGAWNSSSPTSMLKNQVPAFIEEIFEQRLSSRGLGLKELIVLAAVLTDLVNKESLGELDYIFSALELSWKSPVTNAQLKRAFRNFLVAKIWGIEEEGDVMSNLISGEKELTDNYLGWAETKMWESDEIETFRFLNMERLNPFVSGVSFDTAVAMAEELNHRHSQFHFLQCRSLKNKLLELEYGGSGRVPLQSFYSGGDHDHWPFVEKKEYLKDIGVLDETDPKRPSVIIQNYLLGPSNCLETSGYYSLCCRDECEDILAQVEMALGRSSALPQIIVEVVSQIGSESVHAPRNLSLAHLSRLEEIANHHDGEVPLHGRLFAQWLHHVYPQECPYPHAAGTVTRETPDDWAARKGYEDANAHSFEMQKHKNIYRDAPEEVVEPLPWTAVEELVSVQRRRPKLASLSTWSCFRLAVFMSALVSLGYSLTRTLHVASPQKKAECHLV